MFEIKNGETQVFLYFESLTKEYFSCYNDNLDNIDYWRGSKYESTRN